MESLILSEGRCYNPSAMFLPKQTLHQKPKQPFDVDLAFEHIRAAVSPFPKAAMFELAEDGFVSPFELLVACIISIRTQS